VKVRVKTGGKESDKERQRREGGTAEWTHQSSSLRVQWSVSLAEVLLTLPASANDTHI